MKIETRILFFKRLAEVTENGESFGCTGWVSSSNCADPEAARNGCIDCRAIDVAINEGVPIKNETNGQIRVVKPSE